MADPKLKKKSEIIIDKELCKGCRICVAFCPERVLELDDDEKARVLSPEKCNACALCELRCPDMAIKIEGESDITTNDTNSNNSD